jgi:hypothetical protein
MEGWREGGREVEGGREGGRGRDGWKDGSRDGGKQVCELYVCVEVCESSDL